MGALVRYHGGKVRIADKIVGLFPAHDCYVEPFGGGAAVLLAKPRCKLEVYNDLDGEVVNLFRVIREGAEELARAVSLTPWARDEQEQSYHPTENQVERARRFLVRSHFGHGCGTHKKTGFRAAGWRQYKLPVHCWGDLPDVVMDAAARMSGVVIEQRPAIQVMEANDRPETVHYVDPPYLPETRDAGKDYAHEMTVDDHKTLIGCLRQLRGRVVLSGYASELYDSALHDWRRIELSALADGGRKRTEVLWCNFADTAPLFRNLDALSN